MNDVLFNLLLAVLSVICLLISGFLIPWLKQKIKGTKLSEVLSWVDTFVKAAEQTKDGADNKKEYVTELLKKMLISKNIALSDEQINAIVEASVNSLFPKSAVKKEE